MAGEARRLTDKAEVFEPRYHAVLSELIREGEQLKVEKAVLD